MKLLDTILSLIQAAGLHLRLNGHLGLQAVHNAPSPTDVAQLKSFLGLFSYFVWDGATSCFCSMHLDPNRNEVCPN